MPELLLRSYHEVRGALFRPEAGWDVPVNYGAFDAEVLAVRRNAGMIDLSDRAKIRVTGADRVTFVDGLLTADVKLLTPGTSAYALVLDDKSHVLGDLRVFALDDAFVLDMEAAQKDALLARFRKMLVSDDVTLEDVTATWIVLGLFGPRSGDIAGQVFGAPPPTEEYAHRAVGRGGSGIRMARSGYLGKGGTELWIPVKEGVSTFCSLMEGGAVPFGAKAAEALRIETGRPLFGVDMDASTIVLEARLDDAISMTKGCYVGQEIVSRATYIGHVNRVLVGFDLGSQDPPPAGAEVFRGGKAVGRVTSAARSASLGRTVGLGYVRREFADPGTEVGVAAGPQTARVASLPFLRP